MIKKTIKVPDKILEILELKKEKKFLKNKIKKIPHGMRLIIGKTSDGMTTSFKGKL